MKSSKTYKQIIGTVIGLATGALAFIFVNRMLYPEAHLEAEGNIFYKIQKMVNEMNRIVPVQVNETMNFDSIFINRDNTLSYNYTMTKLYKDSVDLINFEQQQMPTLIHNIKTKESLDLIRIGQVTVVYRYYDKNGELFSTITISPDMYMY
ncbi:MAG: hypothetical protein LBL90_08485 [Prevotellaceae bacterium]|jgi:hypothetical protein|nr:hypothetical protein [Prevotellaceae bacterium]